MSYGDLRFSAGRWLLFLLAACLSAPIGGRADTTNRVRPFAPVECPKIPAAYSAILQELSALRSQVNSAAHCEGVKLEVGQLEGLIRSDRRQRLLQIVHGNSDRMLSAQDTEFLQRYAADVSDTSLRLMTLAQGQADCFPNRTSGSSIATIASVVNETSSLLAQVAGPYGVPIAIGANLLTGVLKGIQSFQSARPGYRFHIPEERRSFTEQLCLYHQFRLQIEDLLYPEIGIRGMGELTHHLQTKIIELRTNCSECLELFDELERNGVNPEAREVRELVRAANAKFQVPLGTETLTAWQTLRWANQETERLETVRAINNRSIGPQEVFLLRTEFEDFFFMRQAPEFLRWQLRQALEANFRFERHAENWTRQVLAEWRRAFGPPPFQRNSNLEERFQALANLEKRAERADFDLFIESQKKRSADLLNLTWAAMQVIEDYCHFFRESRALSLELLRDCSREQISENRSRLASRNLLLSLGSSAGVLRTAPAMPLGPISRESSNYRSFDESGSEKSLDASERSWTEGIGREIQRWTNNANRFQRVDAN